MSTEREITAELIRVRGTVQGVGFRPTVWRLARGAGLTGEVWNDADGVGIRVCGERARISAFVELLQREPPPLARIESIERSPLADQDIAAEFVIVASHSGSAQTDVAADAAVCDACLGDIARATDRRYRYPFTNCTHCGPRLSIVRTIPYDRANTSMARFPLCPACQREYADPADRRFHAQPNACPVCGPRVWLESVAGGTLEPDAGEDPIRLAQRLISDGAIVAIKGIGGIHLACDACNEQSVARLRQRKQRYRKTFALMATDMAMVEAFARVGQQERAALTGSAAPIVVLETQGRSVASAVAPGQRTLGIMLPYTPLHCLLMQGMHRPIVLTSGNRSDEPQCIDNDDARARLADIADYLLLHDRDIVNRLDDAVVRLADGEIRLLRRARGYAPTPLPLPPGFTGHADILALGAELKNSFALLKGGRAIPSQHMGDLKNVPTFREYRRSLELYRVLFDHAATAIAVDLHPNYLSTQLGQGLAQETGAQLIEVQHHHAHIASCMAEHGLPADTGPVLGVALDGIGYGADGQFWGAEFLLADYRHYRRVAAFEAVAMPGGTRAMIEPWRNAYAHLQHFQGWERVADDYADLEIVRLLQGKALANLQRMIERGVNSPPASSSGRLFDAVAAVLGICAERQAFEGQAAMELEALAAPHFQRQQPYPGLELRAAGEPARIGFAALWRAILDDLRRGVDRAEIAARFHLSLSQVVADSAISLCRRYGLPMVVLGGGVFQNRLLLEGVSGRVRRAGLPVISPLRLPANDGGVALGQGVVAAARLLVP